MKIFSKKPQGNGPSSQKAEYQPLGSSLYQRWIVKALFGNLEESDEISSETVELAHQSFGNLLRGMFTMLQVMIQRK